MLFGKLHFKLCTTSHSLYVCMVEKVITEQHFILLPAKSQIIILMIYIVKIINMTCNVS
jgi:hypothetical protein